MPKEEGVRLGRDATELIEDVRGASEKLAQDSVKDRERTQNTLEQLAATVSRIETLINELSAPSESQLSATQWEQLAEMANEYSREEAEILRLILESLNRVLEAVNAMQQRFASQLKLIAASAPRGS